MKNRILQEGFGRLVVLEDDGEVVRKTFHDGPPQFRRELAAAEFERLRRFSAALESVPGAACPRPLEVLEPPDAGLRMERAPGVPLLGFLRRNGLPPEARDRFAATLADAVMAYVRALAEPYTDFNFDNVLYDDASDTLTLVDVGLPQEMTAPDPRASSLEITLANLIASVVFQSARPVFLRHLRQHRATVSLATAVVRAVESAPEVQLRPEHLQNAARAAYVRCAFRRSRRRTAWYTTVGYAAGRRVRVAQTTFGPVPPWRAGI